MIRFHVKKTEGVARRKLQLDMKLLSRGYMLPSLFAFIPVRACGKLTIYICYFLRSGPFQRRIKALPGIPGLLIIAKGKGKMLLRVVLLACLVSRVRKTDCYLLGGNKEGSRSKNMLPA